MIAYSVDLEFLGSHSDNFEKFPNHKINHASQEGISSQESQQFEI